MQLINNKCAYILTRSTKMSVGRGEIAKKETSASGENGEIVRHDEHRDLLLAIKSATEKLVEITGGAARHDEERVGLAENNSLKQVQEEILYQMRTMNTNIEALSVKLEESLKVQEDEKKKPVVKTDLEVTKGNTIFPVVGIRFRTESSWNSFWHDEIARMQNRFRTSIDGSSLLGNSLAQIAGSVPRPDTKIIEEKINVLFSSILMEKSSGIVKVTYAQRMAANIIKNREQNRKPVLIEFCNHSDFVLERPQLFVQRGSSRDIPDVVLSGAREVICFYTGIDDEGIQVLCSYQIQTEEMRLVVRLDYILPSSRFKIHELHSGLAFVPPNVPTDAAMFGKEVPRLPALEFNFDKDRPIGKESKFIQCKNLMAASTWIIENNYILLRIQVFKNIQKPSVPQTMKSVSDGYTIPEPSFEWNGLVGDRVSCVVEIENRLTDSLTDFQWHIDNASQYALLPSEIKSFTREMFYVLDDISTKGMVSHLVENTDVRMAVVFWTQRPAYNQFAVGFISTDSATDAATMNSLTTSENWRTRPYILANAHEGEQVLEYRNFRITASMTEDVKAILKIVITAF